MQQLTLRLREQARTGDLRLPDGHSSHIQTRFVRSDQRLESSMIIRLNK